MKTKIIGYDEDNIPIIEAERYKNSDTARFYCEECKRHHEHGAVNGHRIAHCGANSKFYKTGYYLVVL